MTGAGEPPWVSQPEVQAQAEVIERLRRTVDADDRWRWLEVACSLATGRGDELSDVDAGIGYAAGVDPGDIDAAGTRLVEAVGPVVDVLAHVLPGWPPETRRFAVEYESGVQLDLVLMPEGRRKGLPDDAVAVVDKDRRLAAPWTPPVAGPPTADEAREWAMLGWWAVSDAAKYLRRGSLYEAAEQIHEARQQALRLFAVGRGVPYPSFGLVSLLDFPPYELPASLGTTYAVPTDEAAVHAAAEATAELLAAAAEDAATALGADLSTGWAGAVRRRLAAAVPGRR